MFKGRNRYQKTKPTKEETVLETIKLIDKLEAAVCSKK